MLVKLPCWLADDNFDKIFTMSKIVFVLLVFTLLLSPLMGLGGSSACTLGRWDAEYQAEQTNPDPCLSNISADSHPAIHLHVSGCTCALIPALANGTAVISPTKLHLDRLDWPSSAVVLPLTPPPRPI